MEKWQDATITGAWILIAFLFVGMLTVSMILLVRSGFRKAEREQLARQLLELEHRHELLKAQIDASEQEKQRIASDLHDHFGVSLSTLKMKVHQLYEAPVNQQQAVLKEIERLLDRNVEDMRDLSHGIYPPMLKAWGIITALKELAADVSDKTQIKVHYTGPPLPSDDWMLLQLYRICQEFIHNAIRHGEADKISLHFRRSDNCISILMSDNGHGFDPLTLSKGAGLSSIDIRCRALQTHNRLRSAVGKGTDLLLIKRLP